MPAFKNDQQPRERQKLRGWIKLSASLEQDTSLKGHSWQWPWRLIIKTNPAFQIETALREPSGGIYVAVTRDGSSEKDGPGHGMSNNTAFRRIRKFPRLGMGAHRMPLNLRVLSTRENAAECMSVPIFLWKNKPTAVNPRLTTIFSLPASWNRLRWHQSKSGLCPRSAHADIASDDSWRPGTARPGGAREVWITSPHA